MRAQASVRADLHVVAVELQGDAHIVLLTLLGLSPDVGMEASLGGLEDVADFPIWHGLV